MRADSLPAALASLENVRLLGGRPYDRVPAYLEAFDVALNPIRAARTLVLAQAAALTGAAVLGWYAGQLVCALADLNLDHNRALVWPLSVTSGAGLVLAVAGLATQRMCRIPKPPDEE